MYFNPLSGLANLLALYIFFIVQDSLWGKWLAIFSLPFQVRFSLFVFFLSFFVCGSACLSFEVFGSISFQEGILECQLLFSILRENNCSFFCGQIYSITIWFPMDRNSWWLILLLYLFDIWIPIIILCMKSDESVQKGPPRPGLVLHRQLG